MIVVSTNLTWREKIKNLYVLVKQFDYQLIVTVREPSAALFSYYVQRHHIYRNMNKSFLEIALEHESMEIYHYKCFFTYLLGFFEFDRIFVKKFEELIKNQNSDLCNFLGISVDHNKFKIDHINSKKKVKNKIYKKWKPSINDSNFVKAIKPFITRVFNIIRISSNIKLKLYRFSKYSYKQNEIINVPKKDDFDKLKELLKDQTSYLEQIFNVKY